MAIHSSTTVWKIPWTEEPGRLRSGGCKESDTTERLHFLSFYSILAFLTKMPRVYRSFYECGELKFKT